MTADPISDLLTQVVARDRAAFRALYAAASAKLFGVALRILKDRSEAEDALQEVFTRVWLKAHRFDPARARGMTWLIAIARNHAIDRLRARPDRTDGDDALAFVADPTPGVEKQLVAKGEAGRIADCFDTLEPEKSAAIRGAYLDGFSYDDLSRRHDVPLNTMRSWLRRGLLKLKECLEA
ncbi:MAG: sigma-70 family RNA polymerase sigma factor [Albidovulum sp.]